MNNRLSDIISVENLAKVYPDGAKALGGISFKIKRVGSSGFWVRMAQGSAPPITAGYWKIPITVQLKESVCLNDSN